MAKKATVYKANVLVSDMDRSCYEELDLTLAQHPSETDERMMVRLLAFVLNATEGLQFARGMYTDDEPDLWIRSMSDDLVTWIDVGLPAENRIRKACFRARQVILYTYGGRTAQMWWEKNQASLSRFKNLSIIDLPAEAMQSLTRLAGRNMHLHCSVEDGQVWISNETGQVSIEPQYLMRTV